MCRLHGLFIDTCTRGNQTILDKGWEKNRRWLNNHFTLDTSLRNVQILPMFTPIVRFSKYEHKWF